MTPEASLEALLENMHPFWSERVQDDVCRVSDIRRALAEAAIQSSGRTGWQSIETEPQIGDTVFVVYEAASGPRVTTARFGHVVIDGKWASAYKCDIGAIHPTHWQPLPAAPPAPATQE